jgi:hypothetical protein
MKKGQESQQSLRTHVTQTSEECPVYFHPSDITEFLRSRPIIEFAQCGERLFMPEWSEFLDERRVRHLWQCEPCGYSFETIVCFEAA